MENLSKAWGILKKVSRLKVFIIMKLTTFLICFTVFSSFAAGTYSQNTAVSVKMESSAIKNVLKEIEKSTEFFFLYNNQLVDVDRTVSVDIDGQNIETVLDEIFEGQDVDYVVMDRQIVISPKNVGSKKSSSQQQKSISGTVIDHNGISLPGVTVVVVGTTNGTVTDANGNFSLSNIPDDAVIKASFIGYAAVEVSVEGRKEFDIKLKESTVDVDEVVVVGYGSIKKRDITGAVSSISNEDLVSVGTSSAMAAMQGQVAGVNITAKTGLVGSDYDIEIRGVNSLTGGNPLYVIDGVMMDNINFLNPNDIQRIDILKDASSTAIYGSRGSNGVVIVTTRKGDIGGSGKASVSYSGSVGIRAIANMPDFLNYEEGIEYTMNRDIAKKMYRGDELVAPGDMFGFPAEGDAHDYWVEVLESGRHTDWLDLMTKPAVNTNHFVSATGGAEGVSYMIGAGMQSDNGNVNGQYYKKYNFKANIDFFALEQWKMGANINLAYTNRELGSTGILKQLFRMPPWTPAYNRDDEMIQVPMVGISGNVSPLAVMKNNRYNSQDYYVISNFYLEFIPVEWLSLKTTFSPNITFNRLGEYWDPLQTKSSGGGYMSMSNDLSYIWDNQLHASKEIGLNTVNFDFIHSLQMNRYEYLYGFGWDLPFNSEFYNVGSASSLSAASSFQESTLMSYTGRLNYDYADKYMLTASVRWDGSSKLAEGHKWAFFPSAAIAWRLSEEEFMKPIEALDNLKMRLSYGYTGNNNIDPYTTQFAVSTQTYYDWNGVIANGFRPSAIANKELTWERTREWNLGIDFGFFNNRVSGELNLYDKLSLNLLMERKLAIPTGWASMMDNVGSVKNQGIEFQLRTINVKTSDFQWETNFTFAKNNNEIVELYGKKEDDVANRWFIGQPVNVVYAMEFDGVWQRDELTEDQLQEMEGTAKVKDQNNDGNIDIDNDMEILGSPIPDWTGSLSTRLKYKGWDMSATLYTKQGVLIYSPFHREFTDFNSKQILDVPYYMRENPYTDARYSNEYPQPAYMGDYWGEDSEDYGYPGFNKDASFVRLQNVSLGYSLPQNLIQKIKMNKCRLYINIVNPYVWTKYEGFDPEWAGASVDGENQNSNSFTIYQFGANIIF
jgi:TonB-linked SusC/RagA family outer membrane protein